MRKTAQSMYQPPNKSVLGMSKFNGTLQGSGMIGNKSNLGSSNKKIQGQDFRNTSKPNFQQTISKLKSKPNKKVLQDEYINGLQQQIKYLQYELKLLKDKQLMQRQGVNELDNFLKDEIPINENILAMKNKYNATKNKLQEQFKHLSSKNMQASDVLQTQKNQIQRLHQIIDGHRKQAETRSNDFKDKLGQVVKQITLTQNQCSVLTQNNRSLNDKIKKMMEEVANIQRSIQKEKVQEVRALQDKSKAVQKFQEKSKKTKDQMLQALQKMQQVQIYAQQKGTNPLVDQLQAKNIALEKKIMINLKQKSTAQNIIAEISHFLKQQERERQIQRKQKLKQTNVSEQCKNQLQNLQRFSQNMIKEQTLRTKKLMLKQMSHDLKQKQQIYQLLTDRLRELQQISSNLISDKKDLQDILQTQQSKQKILLKKIKQLQQNNLQNICSSASLIKVSKEIQQQTMPLRNQLEKCLGRIPILEKSIEKKNGMIHYMNKQVDLLKELKGLDFDQLQMISTSGIQMQNTLHDFIKNWEKLKSL